MHHYSCFISLNKNALRIIYDIYFLSVTKNHSELANNVGN